MARAVAKAARELAEDAIGLRLLGGDIITLSEIDFEVLHLEASVSGLPQPATSQYRALVLLRAS